MATGGGARGWQFLKRNDHYAEACRALTGPAAAFMDAPFPIRRQSGADLEAGPWGLLGKDDLIAALDAAIKVATEQLKVATDNRDDPALMAAVEAVTGTDEDDPMTAADHGAAVAMDIARALGPDADDDRRPDLADAAPAAAADGFSAGALSA